MLIYFFIICLVVVIFLFLFVGLVTVFESKLLSLMQMSEGPVLSLKGLLQFFYDYVKLLLKEGLVFSSYFFVSFYMALLLFSCFMFSPLTNFGLYFEFSFVFFIIVKISCCVVKICFGGFFNNKFVSKSTLSLKISFFIVELLEIVIMSPIFFIVFNKGLVNWNDVSFFMTSDFSVFFLPLSTLYFFLLVFQVSSSPFDYFESESELVGGVMTSSGGGVFIIWSFVEYLEIVVECVLFASFFFPFLISFPLGFSLVVVLLLLVILLSSGVFPSMDLYSSFEILAYKFYTISFFVSMSYIFLLVLIL